MLEIRSMAYDNNSGIAYLSSEIYEVTEDVFPFKKGDRVRLISDNPDTLGYHSYDPTNYQVVCRTDAAVAQYVGILNKNIMIVTEIT